MKEQINAILDKLRPSLTGEGGDVELIEITEGGVVRIRVIGVCRSCPASLWTHKLRIERAVKAQLPDVKVVVDA